VKGLDEALHTHLVRRALPRAFRLANRGVDGLHTRMIGRDVELQTLQDAFGRVAAPGAGLQRMLVVGEAGVGKSRLLHEFAGWAASRPERFAVFQARATPASQRQPYGLLRDLFARRVQILDNDSMAQARRKFEDAMTPLFVDDGDLPQALAQVHPLGQLIGLDFSASPHLRHILDDGRQIRDRGFHAAARALRRQCERELVPVIVQLDDLHWADDDSLEFLDLLARIDPDLPILVLGLTRPSLFERRPADAALPRIALQPLDETASRALVHELLKKLPAVPDALRELLAGSAQGNPFYMEELLKMLIDQGAVEIGEPWSLNADRLHDLKIPPTLTGVLQARLDGLHPAERHALQLASVIGQYFWDAALAFLDLRAVEQLPALGRHDMVRPQDRDEQVQAYAFWHQVLHQVTYDTVLKRDKRAAHAKAAQWLAEHSGARAHSLQARAAEHFDLAGDSASAAEYHARAAAYFSARNASASVLGSCARGLQLARSTDSALRWRLLITRERTLALLARRDEQLRDIEALQSIADAMPQGPDGDRYRAVVACRRSTFAQSVQDLDTFEREARRAQALAQAAGSERDELVATCLLSRALAERFDVSGATALAESGLARAAARGWPDIQARLLSTLSGCAIQQGRHFARLQHDLQVLSYSRLAGDRVFEANVLRSLGAGYIKLGAFDQARRHLEAVIPVCRSLGDRDTEGRALNMLCDLDLVDGHPTRALALEQEAVHILQALGSRLPLAYGLVNLGRAEQALGRWAEARSSLERGEAMAREIAAWDFVLRALHAQAELAWAEGDGARAAAAAMRLFIQAGGGAALPDAEVLAGMQEPAYCLTLHQIWGKTGDPRAEAALVEGHRAMVRQADMITDADLRCGYLTHIAAHRTLAALWSARADQQTPT
jgi:tetratricopeptide (TPR) repeat protein